MPAVKFTRYFEAARQRPDRAAIRLEWIERVIANPVHEVIRQMVAFGVGRRSPKWTGVICALYCCQTVRRCTMLSSTAGSAIKIRYFQDTDTLYIEFRPAKVSETRDLDENTLLDLDPEGLLV